MKVGVFLKLERLHTSQTGVRSEHEGPPDNCVCVLTRVRHARKDKSLHAYLCLSHACQTEDLSEHTGNASHKS